MAFNLQQIASHLCGDSLSKYNTDSIRHQAPHTPRFPFHLHSWQIFVHHWGNLLCCYAACYAKICEISLRYSVCLLFTSSSSTSCVRFFSHFVLLFMWNLHFKSINSLCIRTRWLEAATCAVLLYKSVRVSCLLPNKPLAPAGWAWHGAWHAERERGGGVSWLAALVFSAKRQVLGRATRLAAQNLPTVGGENEELRTEGGGDWCKGGGRVVRCRLAVLKAIFALFTIIYNLKFTCASDSPTSLPLAQLTRLLLHSVTSYCLYLDMLIFILFTITCL